MLDDITEDERYTFGGPDIVRLQEKKMIEKRKKEKQLKKTQLERKNFISSRQTNLSGEKRPLSREERKMENTIRLIERMEQVSSKKVKGASLLEENYQDLDKRRELEELPSNGKAKLKETGRITYDSLNAPTNRISYHHTLKNKFKISPFTPAPIENEHSEENTNTHLNKKHSIDHQYTLLNYIRQYEISIGANRHELLIELDSKLEDRHNEELEYSYKEGLITNGDKFTENLTSLCNKLNGMDLNQPLKTVLQQLK